MTNAKINEIFDSIQGEGLYIGCRQLFIRFCGCNLLCDYCDTEFDKGDTYTVENLLEKIKAYDLDSMHSISLTGGEPLLHYEFLAEFLLRKPDILIYLETNGTMHKAFEHIVHYTDIISADIKIDSSAKIGDVFSEHYKFFNIAKKHDNEFFAKLVFDENLEDFEIHETVKLVSEFGIPLVLQPKMNENESDVPSEKIFEIFNEFTRRYHNTRLIGQTHKFFGIK
jgi:organic radical activating enzyme